MRATNTRKPRAATCLLCLARARVRAQGETAEERRARKAAVKEVRREGRAAKKATKALFSQEASRAKKQSAGRPAALGSTFALP